MVTLTWSDLSGNLILWILTFAYMYSSSLKKFSFSWMFVLKHATSQEEEGWKTWLFYSIELSLPLREKEIFKRSLFLTTTYISTFCYLQDFSGEQDGVVLPNEWKAHYAVTKAVADVNKSFYKKFKAKSYRGMSRLWLRADYVKCIHPGGELLSGYVYIMPLINSCWCSLEECTCWEETPYWVLLHPWFYVSLSDVATFGTLHISWSVTTSKKITIL